MRRLRMLLPGLAASLLASAPDAPFAAPARGAGTLAGAGYVLSPDEPEREARRPEPFAIAAPARRPPSAASPAYPLYQWPLERTLRDGLVLVNYVDHDPSGGLLDYAGGAHTYDGHAGIDYTLYNFRLMDRGCGIRAASSGTVAFIGAAAPGAFDRSCDFSQWPDDGTWIWVDNGDGSYSEYYHLRAWSLTVQLGETVQAGDLIGLVGSSGYSTAPHLHFETGDYEGGPYRRRDPYTGPANPLPSLWQSQEPYAGDDPLWFADMGVFTDAAAGGSVFDTEYCDLQEGIQAPLVFGIHEPHLDTWFQFQGNPGDPFTIEVRRPDGSLWAAFDDTLGYDALFGWFWAYWFWDGAVGPADYGSWTLRALSNGTLSREIRFEVGPETVHGPRLRRAGRSFRVNGAAQSDTLRLTAQSPAATFSLPDPPSFVTLQDSIVTIAGSSTQPERSFFFSVVATTAAARSDTAWYHVVDPSKPLRPPVSAGDRESVPPAISLRAAPNPGSGRTAFHARLPHAGEVSLEIFDVAGRRIRRIAFGILPQGTAILEWDGRDDAGRAAASGTYLARLAARGASAETKIRIVR